MFSNSRLCSSSLRATCLLIGPLFSEFYATVFSWGHMMSKVVNSVPSMRPLFAWDVEEMGTVLWSGGYKRPKTSGEKNQITPAEKTTTRCSQFNETNVHTRPLQLHIGC